MYGSFPILSALWLVPVMRKWPFEFDVQHIKCDKKRPRVQTIFSSVYAADAQRFGSQNKSSFNLKIGAK